MMLAAALVVALAAASAPEPEEFVRVRAAYAMEVNRRLDVPVPVQRQYAARLEAALPTVPQQYVLLVDRSAAVQAVLLFGRSAAKSWHFIGASPVSTGLPGRVDYFLAPTGIFEHSVRNMDFRSEGTRNALGVRGYGVKGMRVYDFGWALAERGWGGGGTSEMRLQMHATDPNLLEPWLGQRRSKGCIRIPATLNAFIDRYGIIDADYERLQAQGRSLWVLREDRRPVASPGRYLFVIDSGVRERPAWSPGPVVAKPLAAWRMSSRPTRPRGSNGAQPRPRSGLRLHAIAKPWKRRSILSSASWL